MAYGKMLLNVQTQLNLIFKISLTSSVSLREPHIYTMYVNLSVRMYRIEGNFGGCKLWQINYRNTFGGINFGKFEHL